MPTTLEENRRTVKKEKRSLLPELRELSKHLEEVESDMSIFWKMNPALLMLIRNNKVSRVNPSWESYFGYSQEEISGKPLYGLLHEQDRVKIFDVLHTLKTDTQPQTTIARFKHNEKDDWTFVRMSLSYTSDGDLVFFTGWPLLHKCNECPFLT